MGLKDLTDESFERIKSENSKSRERQQELAALVAARPRQRDLATSGLPEGMADELSPDPTLALPVQSPQVSNMDAFQIGIAHKLNRLKAGAMQAMYSPDLPAGAPNQWQAEGDALKAEMQSADAAMAPLQKSHPWMTGMGEALPGVTASMLAPGSLPAQLVVNTAPGLVEYGTAKEKLIRGGAGAGGTLVGAGLGAGINKTLRPNAAEITPAVQAGIDAAEQVGSREPLAMMASKAGIPHPVIAALESQPGKVKVANQIAYNRSAAKSFGEQAESLSDDVFAAGRKNISAERSALLGDRQVPLDASYRGEVRAAITPVVKELKANNLDDIIERFTPSRSLGGEGQSATVTWNAKSLDANRSYLSEKIRGLYNNGNSGLARALERVEQAIDRAVMKTMTRAEQEAYKANATKWANLRLFETGKVVEKGNVSPRKVYDKLVERYGAAYKEGRLTGEFDAVPGPVSSSKAGESLQVPRDIRGATDLAKIGEVFGSVPQAAQKSAVGQLVSNPIGRGIGGAGIGALVGGGIPGMAAGAMVPYAAQHFLNTDLARKWLTHGLGRINPQPLSTAGGMAGALGGDEYARNSK